MVEPIINLEKEKEALISEILALQERPASAFLSVLNQILTNKESLVKYNYRRIKLALQEMFSQLEPQYQDHLVTELVHTYQLTMGVSENILLADAILNVYLDNNQDQKALAFLQKLKLNEEDYIVCLNELRRHGRDYIKEAKYYSSAELVEHFKLLKEQLAIKDMAAFILEALNNTTEENNVTKCKKLLLNFLSEKKELYFTKVDKGGIALEMINYLLYPEKINQNNKNVCGPASFLHLLLIYSPENCISAFIELLQKGCSTLIPLKASYVSAYQDQSLADIFLNALKHASNQILGYTPTFYTPSIEFFAGMTEPSVMEKWLKQAGFNEVQEATILENSNLKWYHHALTTNRIYAKKHLRFPSCSENFEAALAHFSEGKIVVMLVSMMLCCSLTKRRYTNRTMINLQTDHYIIVKDIQRINEDQIDFNFWTWSEEFSATVQLEDFLAGYKGFITATAPLNLEAQALTASP